MEMKRSKIFRSIKSLFILALVFSSFAGLSNLSHFGDSFNTQELAQVPLQTKALFDGMYINHIFTVPGFGGGASSFVYTQISANVFTVSWNAFVGGPLLTTWDVNTQNRIMSNSAGDMVLGDGTHDPSWIFTNVSLGDIVPISVDGEGDHDHNVSGETTTNLPGFGMVHVWVLEDLHTPPGMLWYEKSTGILLNGTSYWMGMSYVFDYVDTNASIQPNLNAPSLTLGSVTPLTGNQTTQFNFSVIYTDIDDNTPISVNVLVNGTSYPMSQQNPFDTNYTDGCTFQFLTPLQPGTYNYSFKCRDYHYYNSTGTYFGLNVSSTSNTLAPILSDGEVNPPLGNNGTTIFVFKVNYTDPDNFEPSYVNITINSTTYSMIKQNPTDINYIDGCFYIFSTVLDEIGCFKVC